MSSVQVKINALRERTAIKKINKFIYSKWFILFVAAFTLLANLFALELIVYGLFSLIALYISVFGRDYLPYVPMIIFCYIAPNIQNNPGRAEKSIFYSSNGGYWIIAMAVCIVAFLIFRMVIDEEIGFKKMFSTKRTFLSGMVALGLAYVFSGVGSKNYADLALKNIAIGLIEFACVAVPYFLLISAVKWEKVDKQYFAYVGLAMGIVVGLELIGVFVVNDVIVNGEIVRTKIYTGWGINNNMGALISMSIPFAFYFIYKSDKLWEILLYNAAALLICVFSILTCSRGSILASAVAYGGCLLLVLIFSKSGKAKIITACSAVCVGAACLLLFGSKLDGLSAAFVNGFVSEGRIRLYTLGWKFFKGDPIFGTTFFSLSEYSADKDVNWIWSVVGDFKSFFPGRWHNTVIQLLASCGVIGLFAYSYHRLQTIKFFLTNITAEKLFIGFSILVLLGMSLIDCHFFNLGPTLVYSVALACAEGGYKAKKE